jgi:hypothetical protein
MDEKEQVEMALSALTYIRQRWYGSGQDKPGWAHHTVHIDSMITELKVLRTRLEAQCSTPTSTLF